MIASKPDTSQRILDVAEQLFAEHGFEGTSLRDITQTAAVNLAAVNYHFGSKEGLFQAVCLRRLSPLIADCLTELERVEQQLLLQVEGVVMSFIRPCLRLSKDPSRGGILFVRLLSRILLENHRTLREILSREYSIFIQRYGQAFSRVLPALSTEDLAWRMHFAFSVVFHAFAGNDVLKIFTKSQVVSARDPEMIVSHLLPFVVYALGAPLACPVPA